MDDNEVVNEVVAPAPKFVIPPIEDQMQNFLFIIWFSNPLKDSVRIILDDASIKMWIKRDKFIKIMSDILNATLLPECQYTLFRIKESVYTYGKHFYYDRTKNLFMELQPTIDVEKIRPMELIEHTMSELKPAQREDAYKPIAREWKGTTDEIMKKSGFEGAKTFFNKMNAVVRGEFKKKKPRPPL